MTNPLKNFHNPFDNRRNPFSVIWGKIKSLSIAQKTIAVLVACGAVMGLTYGALALTAPDEHAPVALPADSTELTNAPKPAIGEQDKEDSPEVNRDMRGSKVKQAPQSDSKKKKHKQKKVSPKDSGQVSNIGKTFKVPSVHLSVPIGRLKEVRGMIEPTNYSSVFWVANRGVYYPYTENGTTYMVTHALDNGIAPGNFLADSKTRKSRVHKGDEIVAGDSKFKVTKAFREGKTVVSKNERIWDGKVKDRMVLITCFPNSNDNLVIIAKKE